MKNNWRNNNDPTFFGVPFSGIFAYLLLIYYWSAILFTLITIGNIFYALLHWKGYSPSGLYYKVMSKIRGNVIYSRPWWFRENWRGDRRNPDQ